MRRGESGFTLVAMLALLAVSTLAVQAAVSIWSHAQQRERERELIRVGSTYALAIEAYRRASPGSRPQFPAELTELLLDRRFVGTKRHLRRLYDDPMRPGQGWQVLRDAEGRVIGVYSGSTQQPIAQAPVDLRGQPLAPGPTYAHWIFRAREAP